MLYLIVGSLTLPLLVHIDPNFAICGVHDGNQDVEHEDAHDDLIESPNNHPHGMGESNRKVIVRCVGPLDVGTLRVICRDDPPEH